VKGYETGPGDYIAFEPEEIAKAVPEADKTLDVEALKQVCGRMLGGA
jgi:DNA end-binding protein Ku